MAQRDLQVPVHGWIWDSDQDRRVFVRREDVSLTVLSGVCTHKQCNLGYDPARAIIVCPCHGSQFDSSGRVIRGPAKEPLDRLDVEMSNGVASVSTD